MIVKVNRISSLKEASLLIESGANILSFTIDSNKTSLTKDSRAISLNQLKSILSRLNLGNTKVSLNFNYYAPFSIDSQIKIASKLKIDFLEFYSNSVLDNTNGYLLGNEVDYILFGDSIGYDTEWDNYEAIRKLTKKAHYITLETESIVQDNWGYFKSEEELGIKQMDTSDILLETVKGKFKKTDILVSDAFNLSTLQKDLNRVEAKGINLSLKSKKKDLFLGKSELSYLSEQAGNYFSLEGIVRIIRSIKK